MVCEWNLEQGVYHYDSKDSGDSERFVSTACNRRSTPHCHRLTGLVGIKYHSRLDIQCLFF